VFKFEDLDQMSRAVMCQKLKDTKVYWKQMYRLKGAFILWGKQTSDLINNMSPDEVDSKLCKSLGDAAVRGEITVLKLTNLLMRLDEYLSDMDARLGDGTKWTTAAELSKWLDDIQEGR